MGGIIPSDLRGARLAIESDIHIADFPSVTSCLASLQFLPNDVYNGLQAFAENIDGWRTNLVTRIKLYSSTIADLQSSTNATSYACDLNAPTNSNISVRLDQLAERFNQLDQRTSSNRDDIPSLHSSLNQFCSVSKAQFLSQWDQFQVLSESSNTVCLPSPPSSSVEVVDTKHTVVKYKFDLF